MDKELQNTAAPRSQASGGHVGQQGMGVGHQAPVYSTGGESATRTQKIDSFTSGDVTLPESMGEAQTGPISAKGEGDAHAFSPNDVRQGSIGDCYFLASLMAVANTNPGLLQKAIQKNDDGSYTVSLFSEQETGMLFWKSTKLKPHNVTIFPTFPIEADGTDTANPDANSLPGHAWTASTDESELWVRLIEKAYALLLGSYSTIGKGGLSADALEVLTGERFTQRVFNDNDKVKERILEMVGDNVPVCVDSINISSASDDAKKFALENSIVQPHAYAVISANDTNITVRNPHGQRNKDEGISGARNVQPTLTWAMFFELFSQYSDKH